MFLPYPELSVCSSFLFLGHYRGTCAHLASCLVLFLCTPEKTHSDFLAAPLQTHLGRLSGCCCEQGFPVQHFLSAPLLFYVSGPPVSHRDNFYQRFPRCLTTPLTLVQLYSSHEKACKVWGRWSTTFASSPCQCRIIGNFIFLWSCQYG